MEQQNYTQSANYNAPVDLPNATGVLVLGILSIIFTGLIGVILAIIALSMASGARNLYQANPEAYTKASYSRINSGRICAIISLCLLGLALLIILAVVAVAS